LQCVAMCCSVLQCVAVCCSVLQCVAVCCSVLQCVAVTEQQSRERFQRRVASHSHVTYVPCTISCGRRFIDTATHCNTLQHTATQCNTLQHTATDTLREMAKTYGNSSTFDCNTLQHTATHCNTLQHTSTHCNRHPTRDVWQFINI